MVKDLMTHKLMNGKNWKDYAVLYRGNFQARILETQLRQMQIPYKLSGGQSFFARAEIKDVMSYLRLIINPEDDSAFYVLSIRLSVQSDQSPLKNSDCLRRKITCPFWARHRISA